MPMGIKDPVIGYIAFTSIKLIGYTVFLHHVIKASENRIPKYFMGALRTLIGVIIGGILGYVATNYLNEIVIYYLVALPFVRLFEWYITFLLFTNIQGKRRMNLSYLGIIISFVLDIPAAIGFIAVGGLWIC